MTPKRWQQIEKLYHESLKLEASRRSAFLDKACAGDEALRREVESLLAHQPQAESFIEAPALEVAAKGMAQNRAPSLVGRQVGPYKIHSLLGVGGMGEVYLAQDPRLDRAIALKILPLEFASDQDRLQRFVREARAASALNHANVAHIYEIGQSDGLHFIAMEYVEGQSLAQKMSGQPLELKEVLDIGIQAADALEEAHRKGITHRDIKPANLMITPKGQVKVLDFGLAKITRPESEAVGSDVSTSIHTAPGMVMGTLRYMSPEQVLGKELDARTDLFSLGVVLYEMTTGRLPFSASNASEVTDRILHAQPEAIARFNYNVPAELDRIIRKCLEKDRERRYQSARELLTDLRNLRLDPSHTTGNKAILVPRKSLHWIATAVLLLAVLLVIGIHFLMPTSQAISSIAVLPFANADADTNAEYLSDGISESLINSLSQLPKLKVMSRNSVFRYKGRESDAQTAGHDLKVQAVLVGRVIHQGGNVTIKTELVNASDGSHIWGGEFTKNLSDIVTVQNEMAREISEKLRLKLTGEEKNRLARRYTENVEAYHLYLKGRHYWNKRSGDELKKAILCFQQAIDLDPSYGLAYAGLAETYVLGAFPLPPSEKIPKAMAAARKALQLDESLAQAHNSLARAAYMYDHNWQEGERGFKRAIELNPSYETAHHWYAEYLACLGRHSESIEEAKKALEVDPLSLVVNWILGNTLYLARQYPQAIEQYRKTLELDPGFSRARGALVEVYEQTGRYAEAISEAEKGAARSGQNLKEVLALRQAYELSGISGYWKQKTARALEQSLKTYYPAMLIAYCYARLSEKDQALMWLDKAYAEHEQFLVQLNVNPVWDNLRSDPRFAAQVTRIGLVPAGQ